MRLPAHCRLLTPFAALGALTSGTPLLAQGEPVYEYAQAAPDGTIVFRSDPVVQALPRAPGMPAAPASDDAEDYDTADAIDMPPPPLPPVPPVPPVPSQPMPPLTAHAAPGYAPPPPGYLGGPVDGAVVPSYGGAYPAPGYAQPMPGYAYQVPGYGYPGYGYGYGYGYGAYTLVPVMVAIPQRQVVRETVTEEWVDAPVRSRTIGRPPRHAAPRGDKRIKGN